MTISCGCEFVGGMALTPEKLKEHYKHTIEVILYWELIMRLGRDPLTTLRLSNARVEFLNAIEQLYPEVKEVWNDSG